jgi:hypothetical protein
LSRRHQPEAEAPVLGKVRQPLLDRDQRRGAGHRTDEGAYQLTAYVAAGAIAGLAGVLLANQAEFVSPAYMSSFSRMPRSTRPKREATRRRRATNTTVSTPSAR